MTQGNRRAQGLSLNVIVIAAVALLVLIIIAAIFSGRVQNFTTSSESCASKGRGATCRNSSCPTGETQVGTSANTDCTDGVCCLPLTSNS